MTNPGGTETMRDDARAVTAEMDAAMPIHAIRTPEQFIAALEKALVMAQDPAQEEEFLSLIHI